MRASSRLIVVLTHKSISIICFDVNRTVASMDGGSTSNRSLGESYGNSHAIKDKPRCFGLRVAVVATSASLVFAGIQARRSVD